MTFNKKLYLKQVSKVCIKHFLPTFSLSNLCFLSVNIPRRVKNVAFFLKPLPTVKSSTWDPYFSKEFEYSAVIFWDLTLTDRITCVSKLTRHSTWPLSGHDVFPEGGGDGVVLLAPSLSHQNGSTVSQSDVSQVLAYQSHDFTLRFAQALVEETR